MTGVITFFVVCSVLATIVAALTFDGEAEEYADYLVMKNYPWWRDLRKEVQQSREQLERDVSRGREFVAKNSPWVLATVTGTVGLVLTALLMPIKPNSAEEENQRKRDRILAMRRQDEFSTRAKNPDIITVNATDQSVAMNVPAAAFTPSPQPNVEPPPENPKPEMFIPPAETKVVIEKPPLDRIRILTTFRSDREPETPLQIFDDNEMFAVEAESVSAAVAFQSPEMIEIDLRQQALREEMRQQAANGRWRQSIAERRPATNGAVARAADTIPRLSGRVDTNIAGLVVEKEYPRVSVGNGILGYRIILENTTDEIQRNIVIEETIAAACRIDATVPVALSEEDNVLTWRIDELAPAATHEIRVDLVALELGDIRTSTRVRHLAAESAVTTNVRPARRKKARIRIDIEGPQAVPVNDLVLFYVDLENTGETVIRNAAIRVRLDDKLQHPRGRELNHRVDGELQPGETHRARIRLKPVRTGDTELNVDLLIGDKAVKNYRRRIEIRPGASDG